MTHRSFFLTVSRATLLAMLFFSPWMLAWSIHLPGLDVSGVNLRLADGLALISVATYALAGWPGRDRLRQSPLRAYALTLLALIVVAASSMLWADSRGAAFVFTVRLVWWAAVAVRVMCDEVPPRHIAAALLLGLLPQAVIGIGQFGAQHQLGLGVLGELPIDLAYANVSVISAGERVLIRLYGLSGHPNVIGGFAAIALLMSSGLLNERVIGRRYAVRAAWLIGLVALLLTFSRSAGLGLLIGLGVIVIGCRPSLKRALSAALVGGIIVGVFGLLFAPFLIGRVAVAQVATEQFSIDERIEQTGLAWSLFTSHPLTGVGIGNYPVHANASASASATGMWAHNVPLLIASELGLPGLAAWLIGVGAVIVAGIRSVRQWPADAWPAIALGAVIAMLTIMLFDHYWWTSSQGVYVWAAISAWLVGQGAVEV